MLSALLVTNAMPRNTHIAERDDEWMHAQPDHHRPVGQPAEQADAEAQRHATNTVTTGFENCHARNASAIVVPASALHRADDRSMPPEIITIVAADRHDREETRVGRCLHPACRS